MWPSPSVFFVTLCLLLSLGSCKESKEQDPKAPEDNAQLTDAKDGGQTIAKDPPAGTVIDLVGTVVATRGDEAARPLTLGASIYAEDQVQTSSDASVAILLTRNGAIHDIGSDQSVTIQGSLAWNAARQEAGNFDLVSDYKGIGTAGAHAEKAAGDSPSTTKNKPPANSEEQTQQDPPGGDADEPVLRYRNHDTPKKDPAPKTRDDIDPRSVQPGQSPLRYGDGGFALDLSKPAWPGRSPTDTRNTDASTASSETPTKPGNKTDTSSPKEEGPKDKPSDATVLQLHNEVEKERQAVSRPPSKRSFILAVAKACQEKHKGQGSFSVQITFSQSRVTVVKTDGPSELAKTLGCVEEALLKSTAGPAEGSLIFTLKL